MTATAEQPAADSIPIKDAGRRIPADVWQKRYGVTFTYE